MKITFIQTGGTIDKDYPRKMGGYAFEIYEPAVKRILERLKPEFDYEIISVLKKDSQDITDDDREKIFQSCMACDNNKIIITHGTDTVIDTAKTLSKITDKLIILTGSFKPERFSDTDAHVNIGVAIGAINILESGVYISMNGRVIPWNRVKRNTDNSRFIET